MPLKIPPGWLVASNSFYDLDFDEQSVKRRLFSQDMLLLERQVAPQRDDAYIVALGWIPSHNPGGTYRIAVAVRDFSTLMKRFESRDRYEIQEKLNSWLAILSSYADIETTQQALDNG